MIRRRNIRALATFIGLAAIAACAPSTEEDAESTEDGVSTGQDPLANQYTGIWTNWYRHELDLPKAKAEGLLKLMQMRQALTKDNLSIARSRAPSTAKAKRRIARSTARATISSVRMPALRSRASVATPTRRSRSPIATSARSSRRTRARSARCSSRDASKAAPRR